MTTPIQALAGILDIDTPADVQRRATLTEAWARCKDGAWMLQVAGCLSGPAWGDGRRPLVFAMCDCVEISLPNFEKHNPGARAPRVAIETARAWARGERDVTAEDAEAAGDALVAAWDALAAGAAGRAAARAKTRVLLQCADITRRHFPDLVRLMLTSDVAKARLLAIRCASELQATP